MQHTFYETQQDGFLISTDPARLQLETIYEFLAQSYWANDRPRAITDRSVENSLCFGVYEGEKQIGFSRVITDYATYAWLCDVFIHPDYRGRGLGKWMMATIPTHPELSYIRRWSLATRDAQEFYRQFGFEEAKRLYALMDKVSPYPPDVQPGSK